VTMTVDEVLTLAESLLTSGDAVTSASLYRKIIDAPHLFGVPASATSQGTAWRALGVIAGEAGNLAAAVAMTERSIQTDRSAASAVGWCNLGNLLCRQGNFDGALEAFQKASDLGLTDWHVQLNYGILNLCLSNPEEAIKWLEKAFTTVPDDDLKIKNLTMDLGYARVMNGDFKVGFQLLNFFWSSPFSFPAGLFADPEAAVQQKNKKIKDTLPLRLPVWDFRRDPQGLEIRGKTLLICSNQGAGDAIQFYRFLPILAYNYQCNICLSVPEQLVRLFKETITADSIHAFDERELILTNPIQQSQEPYDTFLPISLVPEAIGLELEHLAGFYYGIPGKPDYPWLIFPEQQERATNPDPNRSSDFKVGLVWAARQDQDTGPKRSIPLEDLLPLTAIPGTKFYGLQVGEKAKDIQSLGAQHLIEDLSPQIADFRDLANAIGQMDLTISCDTGPLHLAGAMGCPVLGLLSRTASDWRWLDAFKYSFRSPWYPGMQLFRQRKHGDWSDCINYAKAFIIDHLTPNGHVVLSPDRDSGGQ